MIYHLLCWMLCESLFSLQELQKVRKFVSAWDSLISHNVAGTSCSVLWRVWSCFRCFYSMFQLRFSRVYMLCFCPCHISLGHVYSFAEKIGRSKGHLSDTVFFYFFNVVHIINMLLDQVSASVLLPQLNRSCCHIWSTLKYLFTDKKHLMGVCWILQKCALSVLESVVVLWRVYYGKSTE